MKPINEKSIGESPLRAFLFQVREDPLRTIGGYSIDSVISFLHGWQTALKNYEISDKWAESVIDMQLKNMREKYNSPSNAPFLYILSRLTSDEKEQFKVFFEALDEADREYK